MHIVGSVISRLPLGQSLFMWNCQCLVKFIILSYAGIFGEIDLGYKQVRLRGKLYL